MEGRRRRERLETEMGGLHEQIFGASGRGLENERRMGGGRDGSETGLLTKKKGKKIGNQYRCQPHPGLQRQRGEQQSTIPPPPITTTF